MTDTAQSTAGLVRRLVNNPNSTIGKMIKRGSFGTSINSSNKTDKLIKAIKSSNSQSPKLSKNRSTDGALDVLEKTLDEVEATSQDQKTVQPIVQSDPVIQSQSSDQSPIQSPTQPTPTTQPQPDPIAVGVMTQAMPRVINQAVDVADQQQQTSRTSKKEAAESVSLDQIAIDAARGAQLVEAEPQPEIPPEIESYLQKVEDRKETAPQEIVIADGSQTSPNDHPYPSQPVVVLPITAEEEKVGAKKSPKFSVRWLVEWSRKLMKVFMGKIIYRPVPVEENPG
ncbi:MAG: hypothetical protein ABII10_00675 [Candidatus Paceibacterota bacterium]